MKRFAYLAGGRGVKVTTGEVYCVPMAEKHLVVPQGVEGLLDIAVASRNTNVVIHWSNPSGATVDANMANTVFGSLKALWTTNLAPQCPVTTAFTGIRLRDINTPGNALISSSGAAANGSSATNEALPRQIAACLTVRTAKAGKQFRGRMYFTGFSESANGADNHMAAATKTALDAFAAGFVTAANVANLVFGVCHRPTAFDENTGLPISPGLGFVTPAIQVVCRDNVWDSQRRRAG